MIGNIETNALQEIIRLTAIMEPRLSQPQWTDEDDRFIIENYQLMSDEEIGREIGRTATAVKIRVQRCMRLPARSKHPDYITSYRAAVELGIDPHKTWDWVDCGMIKRADIPQAPTIRIIKRTDFYAWAINPNNWIYFDIHAVRNEKLRIYLILRSKRWGDEWWTNSRAADYWNVDDKDVQRYIKSGRLPGVQPEHSLGGRHHNRTWSYWFVRRSDVIRTRIWSKTNGMKFNLDMDFPPAADQFLVKALDELGWNSVQVARAMKKKSSTVSRRYRQLTGKKLPQGRRSFK